MRPTHADPTRPSIARRLGLWGGLGLAIVAALAAAGFVIAARRAADRDAVAARRAVADGRLDQAEAALGRWLQAAPRSAEAHFLRATIALARERPQEALDAIERARELGHPRPPLQRLLGIILARAGRAAEAEPLLREAQKGADRPDAEVAEALARIDIESFRFGDAEKQLYLWSRARPKDPKPYIWKIEVDSRRDPNGEPLLRDYREALARDPTLHGIRLRLANALRLRRRLDEAAAEYDRYLAARPDDPAGHAGIGLNALERNDVATAQAHLDRALAARPDDVAALVGRATIDLRRSHFQDALRRLDRAERLDPFDPEIRHHRATALARLGRAAEAADEQAARARLRRDQQRMDAIVRGLLREPNNRRLQAEAARWLIEHGHDEEGISWARRVLDRPPIDTGLASFLADYYQRKGNPGLATYYRLQARDAGRSP